MDTDVKEKCGVFGIWRTPESADLTYLALYALQHRGQEAAGIATTNGTQLHSQGGRGLVADVFNQSQLKQLAGHGAIGHTRYSTSGADDDQELQPRNIQPLVQEFIGGETGDG